MSELNPLKVIFAGTPDFAAEALQSILNAGHEVVGVYTQPDKPAGRGRHLHASPVKELALQYDLSVYQPKTLRDVEQQKIFSQLNADVMVVAAYGLILPKEILEAPRFGCLNIHYSLLPKWRGAAPVQRAILSGDEITGITIMQMDEGLDTGDILLTHEYKIKNDDTTGSLFATLGELGAGLLVNALSRLDTLSPIKQNENEATHAAKIQKQDGQIDWTQSAVDIERKIRAFNPWPICFTTLDGDFIRIWEAHLSDNVFDKNPGMICDIHDHGLEVATGDGALFIKKLQLPGKKPMMADVILNGHRDLFTIGKVFS